MKLKSSIFEGYGHGMRYKTALTPGLQEAQLRAFDLYHMEY